MLGVSAGSWESPQSLNHHFTWWLEAGSMFWRGLEHLLELKIAPVVLDLRREQHLSPTALFWLGKGRYDCCQNNYCGEVFTLSENFIPLGEAPHVPKETT